VSTGTFCISIDVELAWGIWDRPSADYFARCADREQRIIDAILALFSTHDIRATWAIVGRLLERTPAPPASSAFGDEIWFAPGVVDAIRVASPVQDIGSHSFGHIYFGDATRDQVDRDLEAARRVHANHRLGFSSFVFPRNQVAHLDALAAAGIKVFRSEDLGWHVSLRRLGKRIGQLANLGDKIAPIPPATVTPLVHSNGLVELPSSMLLMGRSGMRRLVRPEAMVWKARLGLRSAARTGRCFHLWFHPSNFYHETEVQLEVLEQIVGAAARMRDREQLEIRTMNDFATA